MIRNRSAWIACASGLCALALGAVSPAVAADSAPKTDPLNELTSKWVDIGGLISGRYTYSFQEPRDHKIVGRLLDRRDNTFAIDTGALFIGRNRADEDFGFQMAFDFFDGAQYTGSNDGLTDDSDDFEVREAFLTYDVPFGGITVKAGKFVTLLGYEQLKTPGNINNNISHSLLFSFTKPFTHTGILATIPIVDMVTFDVGLVNGWDNGVDNNAYKTLLAAVSIRPADEWAITAAGTVGPEQDDSHDSTRGVLTINTAYRPIEELLLAVDMVYGNESNLENNDPGGIGDADWYGLAAYIVGDVGDFTLAVRGEGLYDQNIPGRRENFGVDQGNGDGPIGDRVTVWEISPSVAYHVNDHLTVRIEYRHDEASDRVYLQPNGADGGWNTFACEVLAYF